VGKPLKMLRVVGALLVAAAIGIGAWQWWEWRQVQEIRRMFLCANEPLTAMRFEGKVVAFLDADDVVETAVIEYPGLGKLRVPCSKLEPL
jgi:hypothetical protein